MRKAGSLIARCAPVCPVAFCVLAQSKRLGPRDCAPSNELVTSRCQCQAATPAVNSSATTPLCTCVIDSSATARRWTDARDESMLLPHLLLRSREPTLLCTRTATRQMIVRSSPICLREKLEGLSNPTRATMPQPPLVAATGTGRTRPANLLAATVYADASISLRGALSVAHRL